MRRSDPEIGPPAVARARRGWLWAALPVIAGFALFGVIVWLAYKDTIRGAPIGEPPLIKAAAEPIKLPPEEAEESTAAEGGVVGLPWSDAERADQPERLLPLPEPPRSPPVGAAGASPEQPPELAASSGAPRDGAATTEGPPAEVSTSQPAESAPSADAEAALDRLLAEVTALSGAPPTSTASARPAPGPDQAREQPSAASPPGAAAEAAASTTMGRPAPVEAAGPSEAEREAAASAAPDASTTETAPVRQASALQPPPARPEPAPRERSAPAPAAEPTPAPVAEPTPAPAAEPTPAPAQSTRLAAIDDRYRVQVAAVREEADARRAWNLFVADLGPVLRDVQPFFERAETANGIFYRVQIGPFATQQAADSMCEDLKQRNASCFVIRR
jgi:cell division septation protein DedD